MVSWYYVLELVLEDGMEVNICWRGIAGYLVFEDE